MQFFIIQPSYKGKPPRSPSGSSGPARNFVTCTILPTNIPGKSPAEVKNRSDAKYTKKKCNKSDRRDQNRSDAVICCEKNQVVYSHRTAIKACLPCHQAFSNFMLVEFSGNTTSR
jgi:hypothetical protein